MIISEMKSTKNIVKENEMSLTKWHAKDNYVNNENEHLVAECATAEDAKRIARLHNIDLEVKGLYSPAKRAFLNLTICQFIISHTPTIEDVGGYVGVNDIFNTISRLTQHLESKNRGECSTSDTVESETWKKIKELLCL